MKVGILGGGQLGRMLLQAAANYDVETYVLENDNQCPAAHLCHHFTQGDINNFDDVYRFGKAMDALTIEIERVNIEALEKLEQEGVKVFPTTSALRTIRDKALQKQFYLTHNIPTSEFIITENRDDIHLHTHLLPAVHKTALGGYDGKGVQVIHAEQDIEKGFNDKSVLERKISIQQEVAVMVAVDQQFNIVHYPAVDMVFDPILNLLDYQVSPAALPEDIHVKCHAIAKQVAKQLGSAGIFAVELFVDGRGDVFVNETAPRVHNSGHHTIEANLCSQFDMLWRILLNYPLGNPAPILPSAMVNIIGAENHSGDVHYTGLNEVLKHETCFVHLYGKKKTQPGRKMGHVTILGNDREELIRIAKTVKKQLIVTCAKS